MFLAVNLDSKIEKKKFLKNCFLTQTFFYKGHNEFFKYRYYMYNLHMI